MKLHTETKQTHDSVKKKTKMTMRKKNVPIFKKRFPKKNTPLKGDNTMESGGKDVEKEMKGPGEDGHVEEGTGPEGVASFRVDVVRRKVYAPEPTGKVKKFGRQVARGCGACMGACGACMGHFTFFLALTVCVLTLLLTAVDDLGGSGYAAIDTVLLAPGATALVCPGDYAERYRSAPKDGASFVANTTAVYATDWCHTPSWAGAFARTADGAFARAQSTAELVAEPGAGAVAHTEVWLQDPGYDAATGAVVHALGEVALAADLGNCTGASALLLSHAQYAQAAGGTRPVAAPLLRCRLGRGAPCRAALSTPRTHVVVHATCPAGGRATVRVETAHWFVLNLSSPLLVPEGEGNATATAESCLVLANPGAHAPATVAVYAKALDSSGQLVDLAVVLLVAALLLVTFGYSLAHCVTASRRQKLLRRGVPVPEYACDIAHYACSEATNIAEEHSD